MDSRDARKLYIEHANAIAYIDVETENGNRSIGSAFHIGDGVFVTARHVVENSRIIEVKIPEPVGVGSREFIREILKVDVTDEYIQDYDKTIGATMGHLPMFKHYLKPLEIVAGPHFAKKPGFDVAVFRVQEIHPAAGIVKLGVHWDDWVYRGLWHLSDAIVLGFPPVPMVNEPVLVAARAEIHTFVVPRHAPAVHFILSATPRGGFSGGVAIHESGDALGVITSSFNQNHEPEQLGFFAVLSIEAIVKCLEYNGMYPSFQKECHDKVLGLSGEKT
jgi:hypothetical protein